VCDFYVDKSLIEVFEGATEILKQELGCKGEKPIVYEQGIFKGEEYKIVIEQSKITIFAGNSVSAMYGVMTLSELSVLNDNVLNLCEVHDYPDMEFRAISDDISRGQVPTFSNFKDTIKRLARYKYNVYMPYIEDVFKFECEPEWGKYSDGLTGEEWKSICEYGKKHNVTVRPIVNLLGHYDKNTSLKKLQDLSIKRDDLTPTPVINPLNPQVRPLISKMLDEIVDAFGSGIIHGGGDEPCEITEVYGKEKGSQMFIDHFTWINEELKKRNCSLMMYADMFAPPWGDYSIGTEKALLLPKGVDFVFWDYAAREEYPYVKKLCDLGLEVTISPGSWTWNRFSSHIKTVWDNTKGLIKTANGRCKRMIMSNWGDGGDCPRELAWPGVLVGSNFSWSNSSDYSFEQFYDIFHKSFFGLEKPQSSKLYDIYHYDDVLKAEDNFVFKAEMYKNPYEYIDVPYKENAKVLVQKMQNILVNIKNINPKKNQEAFNTLILAAMRIKFTAEKIVELPSEIVICKEDALKYAEKTIYFSEQIEQIRKYHKKIWFETNRYSEWDYVDMLYKNLRDSFNMYTRWLCTFKMNRKRLG